MPNNVTALQRIIERQITWALSCALDVRSGYLPSVQHNLFQPLDPQTRSEFLAGAGDELGEVIAASHRPKMASLRSSSALAVNFFGPFRERVPAALTGALALDFVVRNLAFEAQRAHGIRGIKPHLDVILTGEPGQEAGVECKFAELYGTRPPKGSLLRDAYFPEGPGCWAEYGLHECQRLALELRKSDPYRRLGAAQLLKHTLGLANAPGRRGPVRLVYLWYRMDGPEASLHNEEVADFAARIGDEMVFRPMTYQDVFESIHLALEPEHRDYLRRRYFGDSGS